jgi:Mg-chelatase subunit ChlD
MPTPSYSNNALAAAPTAQTQSDAPAVGAIIGYGARLQTQLLSRRVLRRTDGGFHAARLAAADDDADVAGATDTTLQDEQPAVRSPSAALPDAPPIALEFALSVASRGTEAMPVRGVVTLRAPPETEAPRVPADLVFVLDVSGSMAGDKMEMLQRTLRWLASDACLKPDDRVAVIAFDDAAWIEMPLRFMNGDGKRMLAAVADGLRPRGGTDITAGIEKATGVLAARRFVNASTAVLLLSDGEDHQAKVKCEPIMRALAPVATVRAVGLGDAHDAALLRHIAGAGRGDYAFANQAADVAPTVGAAVSAATTAVASRLKELQAIAHFPDGTEKVVLTKHELGTMCCGETKHYCFSMDTQPTRVEAHLEYHAPGAAVAKVASALKKLPEGDGAPAPRETLVLVELQWLREETTAAAAEVSRILQSDYDPNDDAGVRCRDVLEAAVRRIEASSVAAEPMAAALLEDLNWMLQGFRERGWQAYAGGARGGSLAAVMSVQARHTSMRATGSLGGGDALYATPSIMRTTRDAVHATQRLTDDA